MWYNNTIKDYPFDVAQANQLLDDAGYKDANNDGVREMPDGKNSLVFRLNWPSDSTVAPRLAELVSATWAQAGIKNRAAGGRPGCHVLPVLPGFRLRHPHLGLGFRSRPELLATRDAHQRDSHRIEQIGLFQPRIRPTFRTAVQRDGPGQTPGPGLANAGNRPHRRGLPSEFYSQAVQACRSDRFKGWITDQPKLAMDHVINLLAVEPVD